MPGVGQSNPSLWTWLPQSNQSPCDRYRHACCSYNGDVYLLGGRNSGWLGDFWKYNVVCNKWTQLSCTGEAAPEELEQHSMVAHKGFLYVFGGLLDSASTMSRCAFWVFDVVKQEWVQFQEKANPLQSQMPSNRKGHSAVVIGSAMLIYGGLVDIKGSSEEFWSLDFGTTNWSQLGPSGSSGPGPRQSHSAVAYQEAMFLFGGLRGLQEMQDFWKWDSSSDAWTCLRRMSSPPRLLGHSAVVFKDNMFLFGGGDSHNSTSNFLWSYCFTTQSWSQMLSLGDSNPPTKIHHCCVGLGQSYSSGTGSTTTSEVKPRQMGRRLRCFKNKCFPQPHTHGADLEMMDMHLTSGRARKDLLDQEDEGDFRKHLPDSLLVLGGKPFTGNRPISIWQMTLS
uniref:F-box protein 42 n=1 Tax=Nothobranchius kadleci TaxID=1051664 RepID=A0A1A8BYM2_NOTKA